MDPIIGGALIGAGSSLLSNIFGRSNASQQQEASQRSADIAWNREYGAYKTRYQDTMADMRAAGLNPILAASGGFNVGSGPDASTASMAMAPAPTFDLASSAKDFTQADKNVKETDKVEKEIEVVINTAKKLGGEVGKIAQETENLARQYRIQEQQLKQNIARTKFHEQAQDLLEKAQKGWQEIHDILTDPIIIDDLATGVRSVHGITQEGIKAFKNAKNKLESLVNWIKSDPVRQWIEKN